MESSESFDGLVLDTLISANYREVERTRQDVLEIIAQYPGLQPQPDNFIYNDGTEQLLLKLTGTLPINYKGNVYNIPIDMWLLNTYPYNAPMVLLCPTPEMRIKVSRHVMPNGRVNLPYLQEWKHNSSELLLLIQVLIITFQDEPPVYSVLSSPPQPLSPPFVAPSHSDQDLTQRSIYPVGVNTNVLSPERLELLQNATERLLRNLHQVYNSSCLEQWNFEQLKTRSDKLSQLTERMAKEKEGVTITIQGCEREIEQLSTELVTHESQIEDRETNIEDAIVAFCPLFRQIVDTSAEESAVQDAIYFISEGFRVGRMELDQFEKTIRKLARKQFMLRLLLAKCRDRAGL